MLDIKITKRLINITLAFFLIGGQALSFNLSGRITLRLGEICSLALFPLIIRRIRIRNDKSFFCLVLWLLSAFMLSLFSKIVYGFSWKDLITGFLYLFRFGYFVFFARACAKTMVKFNCVEKELDFLIKCYLAVCCIGFFQFLLFPKAYDWYQVFYKLGCYFPNPDPHVNRFLSTYFDPNYLSACLLIPSAILIYKLKKERKLYYYICLLMMVVSIFLTKSRSGVLGLGLLFVLDFILSVWKKGFLKKDEIFIYIIALVVVICLVSFSPISVFVRMRNVLTDLSAKARVVSWEKSFEVIAKNPLGIGYNMYGAYNVMFYDAGETVSTSFGVDSSLLLIIISTGILGLFVFLFHLLFLGKRNTVPTIFKSLILLSVLICNFNNLLFYNLWVFPFYMTILMKYYSNRRLD